MGPHDKDHRSLGYAGAIALSALGHAAFLYLVLFALPRWFTAEETPPPAYTVKIVDRLPAGDLGTHLPKLSHHHRIHNPEPPEENPPEPSEEKPPPESKAPKIDAPNNDPNAIALNNATATPQPTPEPTATPTPTPEPTATVAETPVPAAKPTPAPTPEPTQEPTARPTHQPHPRPTARPTPRPQPRERTQNHRKHRRGASPKPTPNVMFARAPAIPRAVGTPSIKERLRQVREQLLKEHLQQLAKIAKSRPQPDTDDTDDEEAEGKEAPSAARGERGPEGPVAANANSNGRGYGVGPGTGSMGILQDPEFLLYYQKVQERIKDAWSFSSDNKELTTTVNFGIGPNGNLTGIEVARSSNNRSFDESVKRAIRRAAPFPPPPAKYRDQFGQGVQAVFRLGDLKS